MLELGSSSAAPAGDLVKDVSEATFMADVVEASRTTPVIVDFWAPWCGPCRALGPALEAAVKAQKGKVRMAKVNVDENQMIAAQMRIQSIPAVYAFVDGQPVDGFMGALPPAEVEAFVKRVAALGSPDAGMEEALAAAEEMLAEGQFADAAQVFRAILEEDPENLDAVGGLARAHLAAGEIDRARAALDAVPPARRDAAPIAAARAQIELAELSAGAGEEGELRARLAADPDDHEARLALADALIAKGDAEGAIDELLELFRRDREWNDQAARNRLLKLFDSLGPKNPAVARGRRRLTSMIYA
ncbi:thioredoxin [Oceanicella actignis]|uniref:Thioredoxin n=1 Tax=Oceanicella actignis TaxID=1189325 RepID=A0A1M7T984_9RHOB|nr:thioredoxin [Oceanicella actignis]TYO89119.1 thioredoxin [Oceanicella actignis]SET50324.1 thioredoxin [Oceanicella actignis]SHN67257.1 thioredoxin [Oceanicella actignis]